MARLIVVSTEGERAVDLQAGKTVTIGRDPANEIPFPAETKASRRHCRVTALPSGGWEVADLGSTNKTRVNGAVAERKVLTTGDVIEIGSAKVRFEDAEEEQRLHEAGSKGVCYLEWATPEHRGEKILLQGQRTTIGRRETNTIAISQDRMASGHHAEIVRDLNGYTIRDLGSTNGTMVNGQPTTEAPLVHGARVRIGNSRFVFKDPSMKDVEVELAQFDEDEGWGMMGEIDLSRAKGSPWTVVAVLLPVVAAGLGLWWLSQQSGKGGGEATDETSRIENGTFEEDSIPWLSDQDMGIDVKRVPAPGGKGNALSVSHGGEPAAGPALVSYVGELPRVARRPYRVRAKMRSTGDADLVVVWEARPEAAEVRAGVVPLRLTVPIGRGGSGMTAIDRTVQPPAWAGSGRLAVRVAPGAKAAIDDVRVDLGGEDTPLAAPPPAEPTHGLSVGSGGADLLAASTVLFAGARPVAKAAGVDAPLAFAPDGAPAAVEKGFETKGVFRGADASGTEKELPGSVRWTGTEEGYRVTVQAKGAERVGVAADLVAAHLQGTVNALGNFSPQPLRAQPGQRLEGVSKILVGDHEAAGGRPPTLFALVPAGGRPEAIAEFAPSDDPGLARLVQWLPGESATLDVVTSFAHQKQIAEQRLSEATQKLKDRPGEAIRELRTIADEFPFDVNIGGEAAKQADKREGEALKQIDELDQALQKYRIYRSRDALEIVETKGRQLRKEFLDESGAAPAGDAGRLETRVHELATQAAEERREFDRQIALPEVIRLERIAALLDEGETGEFKPLAAIFVRAILRRFGAWAGEDSDIGRRVAAAQKKLEALTETVKTLPPEPK